MVNRVTLIGTVCKDPVERTAKQFRIAVLTVATYRYAPAAGGGEDRTRRQVTYHNVTAFNETAAQVLGTVIDGDLVYIEGTIRHGKYRKKDGSSGFTTDIVASMVTLICHRNDPGSGDTAAKREPADGEERQEQLPGNYYDADSPF